MDMNIDLRWLAEQTAQDRVFLSLYLRGPGSRTKLEKRLDTLRKTLPRDEREHFDENVTLALRYLEKNPLESGGLALFSCWANDFLQAVPLPVPVEDLVWVDSSPYVRPLAEFQDEYETVAVVVADNRDARIFLVASAVAGSEERIEGNVKNHVKKGGWSQKRYQRRRDKELLHYARDIVEALQAYAAERILLVGGKEILRIVEENLPEPLRRKLIGTRAVHLGAGEEPVRKEIWDMIREGERRSEERLWERIREEMMRGGLGTVGLENVWEAAQAGRVEAAMVTRTFRPEGSRCRACPHLDLGPRDRCSACGSDSVYSIDVVNELVEALKKTGAEMDFVDPIPELTEAGDVAALLRY